MNAITSVNNDSGTYYAISREHMFLALFMWLAHASSSYAVLCTKPFSSL